MNFIKEGRSLAFGFKARVFKAFQSVLISLESVQEEGDGMGDGCEGRGCEQRGNTSKVREDIDLKAKARIWP